MLLFSGGFSLFRRIATARCSYSYRFFGWASSQTSPETPIRSIVSRWKRQFPSKRSLRKQLLKRKQLEFRSESRINAGVGLIKILGWIAVLLAVSGCCGWSKACRRPREIDHLSTGNDSCRNRSPQKPKTLVRLIVFRDDRSAKMMGCGFVASEGGCARGSSSP